MDKRGRKDKIETLDVFYHNANHLNMDYTDKILNEEEKDNLAIAKFKPR